MKIDVTVAKLRVKVIYHLKACKHLRLRELKSILAADDNSLDTALQRLRETGQIHYAGPKVGWVMGEGAVYKANQRFKRRRHADYLKAS